MDRGYANFHIDSTQVAIAPEKDDIFITINVNEGEVYKVSDIKLAGTMVVPEAKLRKLLLVMPGADLLAQARDQHAGVIIATASAPTATRSPRSSRCRRPTTKEDRVADVLHRSGQPRLRAPHQFQQHRRAINDETLRREMRQLEGGWLSNRAVERSKQRLQRLPYVEKVEFENKPVAGSAGSGGRRLQHQGRPAGPVRRRHRLFGVAEHSC